MNHFEMCKMLLSFNRAGILKSEGLAIQNDMGAVKSLASGDIKPCLFVQACLHMHSFS